MPEHDLDLPDFLYRDDDDEVRLSGHRLRLIDVAARYEEGYSPEAIAMDVHPTLELPLAYKVLAYYLEHESEVKALIARNAAEMARQAAQPQTTPTLAELRRRMQALRRPAAS